MIIDVSRLQPLGSINDYMLQKLQFGLNHNYLKKEIFIIILCQYFTNGFAIIFKIRKMVIFFILILMTFIWKSLFCYIFNMNFNEQQRRISLLNEYAQCLQKQNNAKNIEINTLHEQLSRVQVQNSNLRIELDAIKLQQQSRKDTKQSMRHHEVDEDGTNTYSIDVHSQTQHQEEEQCSNPNNLISSLSSTIKEKDQIIGKYHKECQEMFEAIEKLQNSNKVLQEQNLKDRDIMTKLEQKLRKQEQKRHAAEERLENISYNIYSAGEEAQNYKRKAVNFQKDIEQLIIQNNTLIQKVRALQRQKNQYYHQIKRMSRVSFGGQGLGKSTIKKSRKVSDQRFKQIEQHLRRIQIQNQAIQSNLMIK